MVRYPQKGTVHQNSEKSLKCIHIKFEFSTSCRFASIVAED